MGDSVVRGVVVKGSSMPHFGIYVVARARTIVAAHGLL
jgi:hypothetical protein